MSLSLSPQAPVPGTADPIKDVELATFMVDVIEASKEHVVVVDFWAPWCGPCKQLTPILEKLVRAYKGAVHLAKIDIDQNPDIAQQMGVQSIPAVFAFFGGRPVDGFMGVQSEAQVKSWLERVIKTTGVKADQGNGLEMALKQAADFLAAKDISTAQSIYTDILDMEPTNAVAYAGFLRCLIAVNDMDAAKEMLANAPPEMAKDKAFEPIRTAMELADQAGKSGSLADLQSKVDQNPTDHQARFDLAMAHYAAEQKEQAVDHLLEIIRRDRKWNEDGARKQLVKFFDAFGPTDPLTLSARKRLSSILFA
jgi:putative thioredoxin